MTNPQVEAARRVMNKHKATVKIEVTRRDGDVEIHTPYLIAIPGTRGTPVRVDRDTPVSDVMRLFTESLRSLQQ